MISKEPQTTKSVFIRLQKGKAGPQVKCSSLGLKMSEHGTTQLPGLESL